MKKLKLLTLSSIFILVLLSLSMVCASENITEELSDTSDETVALNESQSVQSASVSVVGNNFDDIQKSVDKAKEGDVIELSGTYSGFDPVLVSKSLTFQSSGNAATLNGSISRIFSIQKGDVTFKNIIFANGNAYDDNGGAVFSNGNCVFQNCVFKNNAAKNGGAVCVKGSLTLTRTTFENNAAKSLGGAIYCAYEIKKDESKSNFGTVEINGCTFTGNTAGDRGGAVYTDILTRVKNNKYWTVNIKNSKFSKNKAAEWGGAVYSCGDYYLNGKLVIDKSNFTQNDAEKGSAVHIRELPSTISNSNFNKNTGDYGAVFVWEDSVKIKNCKFTGNSAKYISAVFLDTVKASIVDSKFSGNSLVSISSYCESQLKVTKGKSTTTYKDTVTLKDSLKKYVGLTVKVSKKKMVGRYDSKKKFTFQLIDKATKKPVAYYSLLLMLKNGKKSKQYFKYTNKKGKFSFALGRSVKVGSYKVSYVTNDWGMIDNVKHVLKVKKAKPIIKVKKVTAKYKQSKYFKAYVKNDKKEPIYGFYAKLKVYTGKHAKTYVLRTDDDDGSLKINTKSLSRGTHKVVITPNDGNYQFKVTSKIKIK